MPAWKVLVAILAINGTGHAIKRYPLGRPMGANILGQKVCNTGYRCNGIDCQYLPAGGCAG